MRMTLSTFGAFYATVFALGEGVTFSSKFSSASPGASTEVALHLEEDVAGSSSKRTLLMTRRSTEAQQESDIKNNFLDELQDSQGGREFEGAVLLAQPVNASKGRISMLGTSPSSNVAGGSTDWRTTRATSSSWLSNAFGFSKAAAAQQSLKVISSSMGGAENSKSTRQSAATELSELLERRGANTSKTRRSLARINKALTRIDMASKSLEPLEEALYARKPQYQAAQDAWQHIKMVRRHQWDPKSSKNRGMASFWSSAVFFEWVIFFTALPCFVMLHYHLIDWPSTKVYHALALFIWLLVAAIYATVIWMRLGTEAGIAWTTGYILEFIFSIENIFVFHIVISAFKTPIKLTQRALFIVICCQAAFQMVFYMGLAHWLRSLEVLPYILGIWLLYVGVESVRESDHGPININDTMGYRVFSRVLGNRLSPEYEEDGLLIFSVKGRFYVSLLAVVTACLLTVDFLLEIDVTLTKIEELDNEYLAFTSSVVAAFAAPELFFVARDLFQRYHLLRFGVSFVLIFFGMQMLCHRYFTMPELLGCGIIVIVMIGCIIASHASKYKHGAKMRTDSECVDS